MLPCGAPCRARLDLVELHNELSQSARVFMLFYIFVCMNLYKSPPRHGKENPGDWYWGMQSLFEFDSTNTIIAPMTHFQSVRRSGCRDRKCPAVRSRYLWVHHSKSCQISLQVLKSRNHVSSQLNRDGLEQFKHLKNQEGKCCFFTDIIILRYSLPKRSGNNM